MNQSYKDSFFFFPFSYFSDWSEADVVMRLLNAMNLTDKQEAKYRLEQSLNEVFRVFEFFGVCRQSEK